MHLIFPMSMYPTHTKNKQTWIRSSTTSKIPQHHLFMKIIRILLAVQQHQRLPSCCARKNLNSRRWWWRWIRINRRKTSARFIPLPECFFFTFCVDLLLILLFTSLVCPHTFWSRTRHGRPQSSFSFLPHRNGTNTRHVATLFEH